MSSVTENVALSEIARECGWDITISVSKSSSLWLTPRKYGCKGLRCSQKYAIVFPAQMVPDSKGDESVNKLLLFYAPSYRNIVKTRLDKINGSKLSLKPRGPQKNFWLIKICGKVASCSLFSRCGLLKQDIDKIKGSKPIVLRLVDGSMLSVTLRLD